VENGIGQGTVRLSPFGVALMSATVASGPGRSSPGSGRT
jgi:cell division protein FtsI/penicillin-binding protein 2